jgi:tRNA (mo5U34)-methyltransferase
LHFFSKKDKETGGNKDMKTEYSLWIINMEELISALAQLQLNHCRTKLENLVKRKREFMNNARGNFLKFSRIVAHMQDIPASEIPEINRDNCTVMVGDAIDMSQDDQAQLHKQLMQLCPWRKGPFNFFGIHIDSEWQSWMKWDRVLPHISPLKGRKILDIGSGNGYYMFRAADYNPLMVMGLEPQSLFYFQYLAVQKYLNRPNVFCLPIPHEDLPDMGPYFNTVFLMGILYHRPCPIQVLQKIHGSMEKNGELVIENLVLNSKEHMCLFPYKRYAKMRNIYFIPDLSVMESWLTRAGFSNIRCVNVTRTSVEEQRKTQWVQTESLIDFLDPKDNDKTVEGYQAPVRAIFIARA